MEAYCGHAISVIYNINCHGICQALEKSRTVSFDLSRIRDRVVILHDSSICDKPQADYHAEKREGGGKPSERCTREI